jgi:hypothetical protein
VKTGQQLHAMDDITGMLGALSIFSTIRPLARCLVASEVFLPKVGLLFCKYVASVLTCLQCCDIVLVGMRRCSSDAADS